MNAPTETAASADEIAVLLKKSKDTIYRLARSGSIPGFKVGREWRFFPTRVVDHLNAEPEPWQQSARSVNARRVA